MNTQLNTTFGLPQLAIDKLRAIFGNYNKIKRVIIYGSRAMGNYRIGSDIDLCIDAPQMALTDLLKIDNQIDDIMLPWKVDLSLKSKIDNPSLIEHIDQFGVVFYSV